MDDGFPSTFPCPYWRTDTKPEAKSNSFTVFSLIQGEPFYRTLFFPLCHKAMLVNCLINRFVVRRLNAVEGWRPCLCRSAVAPSSACPDDWTELWDVEGSGYSPTFSWTFLLDFFWSSWLLSNKPLHRMAVFMLESKYTQTLTGVVIENAFLNDVVH